jgi:hypothetical protein
VRVAWSRPLPAVAVSLSLAREPGLLLVLDADNHLVRLDRLGQVIFRKPGPAPLAAAVCSDDGSAVAAIGKRTRVWLMTPELSILWERALMRRPVALALEPFGRLLAVADDSGAVYVFDTAGKVVWTTTAARPLLHLAFVPEEPILVGSAEFGLVCAFDRGGRCLWRDGPVAHVGSLSVSGDGGRIVLACFTDGLYCYAINQQRPTHMAHAAPARLATLGYTGKQILTAGLECDLALGDAEGIVRDELCLPAAPVAIALEALGESAVAVLASGDVVRIQMTEDKRE